MASSAIGTLSTDSGASMSLSNEIAEEQTLEQLREALKRSQQQYAKLKVKNDELVQAVYQAAKDASLGTPPVKVKPPTKDTRKGKAEVAVIHCTDWQLGKKSVSYGSETCGQRIDRFIDKTLHITEIQRKHHPVREAVLMLGGDMVEGMGIFPGQAYEVDSHLYEQLFEVSRLIAKTVTTLASNFETVRVVCEYGNHGRIGRYGEMPKGDNLV
jgi:DNA polymerase II small subunit/DNA polymerase delta subunit B